jgi:hypothetical protein
MPSSWFIRHWPLEKVLEDESTVDNQKIQEQLFEDAEIAVHYEDICSINHRKYAKDNQRKVQRFRELQEDGGFVCADYPLIKRMRVGIAEPKSEFYCSEEFHFLKRLRLEKSFDVSTNMRVRLLAGAPRQGTLLKWHVIGDRLEHLISGKIEESWEWLLPYEKETVCQEYLRKEFHLLYLLLPFGRALEDIDIAGVTEEGQRIYALLTNEEKEDKLKEKVQDLSRFDGVRVFFCPENESAKKLQREFKGRITFVWSNKTVWEWLSAPRNRRYKEMLFSGV